MERNIKQNSLYFKMLKVYSTNCMGLLISFYFIKNVSHQIIILFLTLWLFSNPLYITFVSTAQVLIANHTNFPFFKKRSTITTQLNLSIRFFFVIQVKSISSFSRHCKYEYEILQGLREKTPFNQSSSRRHIPKCIFSFLIIYPVPYVWHSRRQIFFRASKTPQALPTATDM